MTKAPSAARAASSSSVGSGLVSTAGSPLAVASAVGSGSASSCCRGRLRLNRGLWWGPRLRHTWLFRVSWALAPELAQALPPSLAVLPAPLCLAVAGVGPLEVRRARWACPRFPRTPGERRVCAPPAGSLPGGLAVAPVPPPSCCCSSCSMLSSDSSSAWFCGILQYNGWRPGVQGLLGARLLRWCCRGFWRRRFLPLPVGVLKSSLLPPFYPLGLLLQRAGARGVLFLPLPVFPVVLWRGPFPPGSPLLAGRVLPRSAATCRLLCGGPRATAGVAPCCLALVPSSYALPTLPRVGWVLRVLTPGLVLPAIMLVPLLAVLLPGFLLPAPVLVLFGGFPPVPRPPAVSIPVFFFVPVAGRFEEGRFHPLPGE